MQETFTIFSSNVVFLVIDYLLFNELIFISVVIYIDVFFVISNISVKIHMFVVH